MVSWTVSLILLISSSSKAARHVLSAPERFLAEYQCTATTVDSTGYVGEYTSLQLNANGNAVISYYDRTNGDLKLATCNDAACSSPVIKTVDSTGDVGEYTSLQLNAIGNAVISYYDKTNGDLKLATCNDDTCSIPATIIIVDSTLDVGQYSSLQLNAIGNAVISYFDSDSGALKLATCNNAACSSPIITTVDPNGVGEYSSLQLNANDHAVISYFASFPDLDLKLATCNDAACSLPVITTVDSQDSVGSWTSLQLNASGNAVISYTYFFPDIKLKLATCNNAACSSPVITTVDSPDVGQWTSLQLNANGNAVISYYAAYINDLKLATCNDAACSLPVITTVDSPGSVGTYSSLQLKAKLYPVISYFHGGNKDLKLFTCNEKPSKAPSFKPSKKPSKKPNKKAKRKSKLKKAKVTKGPMITKKSKKNKKKTST